MSKLKFMYVVLLVFLMSSVSACINEYRALLSGEIVYADRISNAPRGRFNAGNNAYLLSKLHQADSIYKLTNSLEDYSDWGAMLVYTGQYEKAKQVFLDIEQRSPGLYQTAANLGTTYELLGHNDSALFWIKRAVAINPNSHKGSEWIHVKILEAKIRANGNAQYLWRHDILSLDFGADKVPVNNTNLEVKLLSEQIAEQLSERMSFVKPKDPVVAQLLFDLGNALALAKDATAGLQAYRVAKEYGYTSALFEERLSHFESLQIKADFMNSTYRWAQSNPKLAVAVAITVFVLILSGMVFLLYRFRKNRRRKRVTQGS